MPTSRSTPGERALIERLRTRMEAAAIPGQPRGRSGRKISSLLQSKSPGGIVKLGLGDDCAILRPPRGHEVLVTTDFSLETIHFRRDWHSPESAGHRALARGLSDLAAMGARPLAAFLSLALPAELLRGSGKNPSWRDRFFDGLLALAARYRVPLAGGDTAGSPQLPGRLTGYALADITLIGTAPPGRALLRSAARAGDRIYVTGQLGGAAAELAQVAARPGHFRRIIQSSPGEHPHLFPEPRLAVGHWLGKNRRATAAIDLSDGLSTDLDHVCEESGLAATVDAAAIPVHPLAGLDLALHGGEDYELLFTAPAATRLPARIAGIPIACIGEMRGFDPKQPRVLLRDAQGHTRPLEPQGWEHYRNRR